jgi:hypothetical protein
MGSNQASDPFLLSLLNHITLPPQAQQSASSPTDFYLPHMGWSPQSHMTAGVNTAPMQYNMGSTSDPMSSYVNQAQLIGINPAQNDAQFNGSREMPAARNDSNPSPNDTQNWNGYFGSS